MNKIQVLADGTITITTEQNEQPKDQDTWCLEVRFICNGSPVDGLLIRDTPNATPYTFPNTGDLINMNGCQYRVKYIWQHGKIIVVEVAWVSDNE